MQNIRKGLCIIEETLEDIKENINCELCVSLYDTQNFPISCKNNHTICIKCYRLNFLAIYKDQYRDNNLSNCCYKCKSRYKFQYPGTINDRCDGILDLHHKIKSLESQTFELSLKIENEIEKKNKIIKRLVVKQIILKYKALSKNKRGKHDMRKRSMWHV